MSDETQEPTKQTEPASEPKPQAEPKSEPVKPDVITKLVDDTALKELTKSLNELKQVEKAIYEQQQSKQSEVKQNGKKIFY